MESVKQYIDHLSLQKKNIYFEELILKNLILLPAGNGRVSLVTLPLFLLFLDCLESWVEVQEMATETIAEE